MHGRFAEFPTWERVCRSPCKSPAREVAREIAYGKPSKSPCLFSMHVVFYFVLYAGSKTSQDKKLGKIQNGGRVKRLLCFAYVSHET